MSFTSTVDVLSQIPEQNGSISIQSRLTRNSETDRFAQALQKKSRKSKRDVASPLADTKDAKTKWTFLRKNADVLTRKSIVTKISEQRYKHFTQVPSPEEFFNTIMMERNMQQKIIEQRRQTFDDKQTKERTNIASLVFNEKLAKIAEQKRQEKNQNELSNFIRLLRTNPEDRSIDELNIILDWMMKHTPHESIVYQFLLRCSKKEVLQFCAGLNYGVYGTKEAIIRQHERGNIYYILISGKASVYINKHLPRHCIADETGNHAHGIGEKIDSILPGGDFGEYGLLQKVKRTATVLSEAVSECIQITEQHFQESIARYVNRYTVMVNKFLRGFYELQDATDRNLNSMFKKFKKLTIYPGKVLQTQNQPIKTVYFIKNATISEWYNLKSKSNKRSIRQQFRKMRLSSIQCKNGIIIGGFYAIKNMPAPTTIICDSECSALAISVQQWLREVSKNIIEKMNEFGTIKHENTLKRINEIKESSLLISDTLQMNQSNIDKLPLVPSIASPVKQKIKKKKIVHQHFDNIHTKKDKKTQKRSQSFVSNVSYTDNKQRLRSASVLNLHNLNMHVNPNSKQVNTNKVVKIKKNNKRSKSMAKLLNNKNNPEFQKIKRELSRLSCKYERRQTNYFQ